MACNLKGITITRGDDSDALGNTIKIVLKTELDLTDYTAIFQVKTLKWYFNNITGKELEIVFTRDQTLSLDEGVEYAALKIFDNDQKAITVFRDIPIYVKTQVVDNE